MKRIFIAFGILLSLVMSTGVQAQSFTVQYDTANFSYAAGSGSQNVPDYITPNKNMMITWNVISTNFPADWQSHAGICDNSTCYSGTQIFTVSGVGPTKTSNIYDSGVVGDYHMQLDLDSATATGCYSVTVQLKNSTGFFTKDLTFMVCKYPTSVPTVSQSDEVILYPNPAQNEVNAVFDGNSDIKIIGIYNLIGKPVSVFKVSGNSANMNIENIPTGLYFMRLINSHGDVVLTRKFTKQ